MIMALTHRSFSSQHNERLEFLGDSVLSFLIANELYKRFPRIDEGDLSRLRAQLVKESSLSTIATSMGLGDFIRLGEGELKSAGWRRPSILADTFESIIGAIYLDGGIEPTHEFVLRFFETQLNEIDPKLIQKDPKTLLQELLQSKKSDLPIYAVVAIVGRPNVGKSTLLNYLVGSKISITSKKAQTTRYQLLGIQTIDDTQFLFIDTPGFQLKHLNLMNKGLNKTVNQVLSDVDVVLFVIESRGMTEEDQAVMKLIPKDRPTILVMNKVDLMKDKNALLKEIKTMSESYSFKAMVPVSAKKNKHLDHLLSTVRDFLPEQPFIYGEDEITDKSERFLASEIIREKIFRLTGQEVPYSIAVEIEKFEVEGNLRRIFAAIIVDKESQKPMLIGKDGEKLKQISTESRQDMEELFGGKVWLETWVKVKSGWSTDQRVLKSLGL